MPSALQKLSRDIIVYSVLLADYEKPDFKDDALAGVRANYFNSKGASQSDKTEMELDGRRLRLRYEMKTGKSSHEPWLPCLVCGDHITPVLPCQASGLFSLCIPVPPVPRRP